MSTNIILNGLTREELQSDILEIITKFMGGINENTVSYGGCINGVEISYECKPKTTKNKTFIFNEKYLTRGEVANFLKISLPTLHRYTKDGVLKSYRIVGKIRYKLEEVENALKERNFGLPKKGGRNV
jgi:excisionase family DNA binding protein